MRTLLVYLVKLARDAQYTDKDIADELLAASEEVRKGKFWPYMEGIVGTRKI